MKIKVPDDIFAELKALFLKFKTTYNMPGFFTWD
jgi:hypothetical protein